MLQALTKRPPLAVDVDVDVHGSREGLPPVQVGGNLVSGLLTIVLKVLAC